MPLPTIPSGNVASATASTGYEVANSCMFHDGDSAYLTRNLGTSTAGSGKKFTFSAWVKRATLGTTQYLFSSSVSTHQAYLSFESDNTLRFRLIYGGTTYGDLITNAVFRDPTAWLHIIVNMDTTQSTDTNRTKMYVNGSQVTNFSTSTRPNQDSTFTVNNNTVNNQELSFGRDENGDGSYFDGYMTEVAWIDGTAYAASNFGEYDEDSPQIWKPKDFKDDVTFGTHGVYLDFEDSGDLDDDESGNGNDFTATNLAATDQSIDTCTINYPILNSVVQNFGSNNDRFLEGALKYYNVNTNWESAFSTFGFTKAKWYWEVKIITLASSNGYANLGVQDYDLLGSSGNTNANFIFNTASAGMELDYRGGSNNNIFSANSNLQDAGVDWAADDIVGFAADMDNKKLYMHKNGTYLTIGGSVGNPTSGSTGTGACAIPATFTTCTPAIGIYGANAIFHFNFGSANYTISSSNSDANSQGSFEYSVPSGYFALNSKNLAEYG
tara:strand:- start:1016 stop:2503 length:1488 start_codon:yes stop_codon:yes gene_type:complete